MKQIRNSTWVIALIFLGALALYILFRPNTASPSSPTTTTTTSVTATTAANGLRIP
jgi:YbbR domain-containing protein